VVEKARTNKLMPDDFAGATMSLTNPGGLGTVASVPRLMAGQGSIIAVGAITYPPEFATVAPEKLGELGVSKVMTVTSTYDHRIIQGAESGAFLASLDGMLQGEDGSLKAWGRACGSGHRRRVGRLRSFARDRRRLRRRRHSLAPPPHSPPVRQGRWWRLRRTCFTSPLRWRW
jgi:hypothetical protein